MGQVTYHTPGSKVVVIIDNRIHSAEVVSVTVTCTCDYRKFQTVDISYGVEYYPRPGRPETVRVQDKELAVTREELIAKL